VDSFGCTFPDAFWLPCQKNSAGTVSQEVGLWIFQQLFLTRGKQIKWRFIKGVNRQMPLSPARRGRQTEINGIGAGIEQEA
jgi:hypothetical protein